MLVEIPQRRGMLVPLPLDRITLLGQPRGLQGLQIDRHGNVAPGSIVNLQFGVVAGSGPRPAESEGYLQSLIAVPKSDSGYLARLSQQVCEGCITDHSKVQAVTSFLSENFGYSLQSDLTSDLRGRSPLVAFLMDGRDAHCEYFATAAALMLRTQEIPCRLSIGYLVNEMNESEDFFVATNSSAHAWVEAYDREANAWLLVEATPGYEEFAEIHRQGRRLLDGSAGTSSGELAGFFQQKWSDRLWIMLGNWEMFSWEYLWIWMLLGTLGLWGVLQIRGRIRFIADRPVVSAAIRKADRMAARLGVRRDPAETCLSFALRLHETDDPELNKLGDWYVNFSEQRYQVVESQSSRSAVVLPRIRLGRPQPNQRKST